MTIPQIPQITTPGAPPDPLAPQPTFRATFYAYLQQLVTAFGQANTVATWMGTTADTVATNATTASNAATAASTSASEAADSASDAQGFRDDMNGLAASGIANYKGDHDGATAYVTGDSVTSGDFFWAAKRNNTGVTPVEGDDWTQISARPKSWVFKTTAYTAKTREKVAADVSGGAWTLTLPASPAAGDWVQVAVTSGDPAANNLTVDGGAADVQGDGTLIIDVAPALVELVYNGTEWRVA